MEISTAPFRISSTTYIRRIMKRWFSRYLLLFLAALVAFAVMGFAVNAAFFIVALIFIFIISPTALMIVYYYYGLTPRIVMLSSFPVTLSLKLSSDSVTVRTAPDDRPPYEFDIPVARIKEINPGDTFDSIVYDSSPSGFVLIDKNAFPSNSSRIQFHNYIFDKIQVNSRS
jgi:hypothetical protein